VLKDVYQWRIPAGIVEKRFKNNHQKENFMKNFSKNQALQRGLIKVTPLGVNSNFRYWGDGITPYVKKGKDGYLWDVDGQQIY
jgi:hypothetical protein